MAKTIIIEMVSDFACPWCLIGKRRLQKAIEKRSDLDIALVWRPFQLNPDMPRQGRNRRDYYRNKFGALSRYLRAPVQNTKKLYGSMLIQSHSAYSIFASVSAENLDN